MLAPTIIKIIKTRKNLHQCKDNSIHRVTDMAAWVVCQDQAISKMQDPHDLGRQSSLLWEHVHASVKGLSVLKQHSYSHSYYLQSSKHQSKSKSRLCWQQGKFLLDQGICSSTYLCIDSQVITCLRFYEDLRASEKAYRIFVGLLASYWNFYHISASRTIWVELWK